MTTTWHSCVKLRLIERRHHLDLLHSLESAFDTCVARFTSPASLISPFSLRTHPAFTHQRSLTQRSLTRCCISLNWPRLPWQSYLFHNNGTKDLLRSEMVERSCRLSSLPSILPVHRLGLDTWVGRHQRHHAQGLLSQRPWGRHHLAFTRLQISPS